jgi:hypothetical protein
MDSFKDFTTIAEISNDLLVVDLERKIAVKKIVYDNKKIFFRFLKLNVSTPCRITKSCWIKVVLQNFVLDWEKMIYMIKPICSERFNIFQDQVTMEYFSDWRLLDQDSYNGNSEFCFNLNFKFEIKAKPVDYSSFIRFDEVTLDFDLMDHIHAIKKIEWFVTEPYGFGLFGDNHGENELDSYMGFSEVYNLTKSTISASGVDIYIANLSGVKISPCEVYSIKVKYINRPIKDQPNLFVLRSKYAAMGLVLKYYCYDDYINFKLLNYSHNNIILENDNVLQFNYMTCFYNCAFEKNLDVLKN